MKKLCTTIDRLLTNFLVVPVAILLMVLNASQQTACGFEADDSATTQDIVRYRDAKTDRERTRNGTIVEYSGKSLVIKVKSGNEIAIPSDLVIKLETLWSEPHQEGNRLFETGDFAGARRAFEQAIALGPKQWIQRLLMARRTLCLSALNQHSAAVDSFLRIVAADPATQHFGAIPLNWETREPAGSLSAKANEWIKDDVEDDAVRQLIGASWMLSGAKRGDAIERLKQLTVNPDSRIAMLSTAQLWRSKAWRTTLAEASTADFDTWQKLIRRMPDDLQHGPLYVCGSAMLARGQNVRQSVLLLLRVPMLSPEHHQLAARCLFESAVAIRDATETSEQIEESDLLFKELIDKYARTDYAAQAKSIVGRTSR